MMGQDSLTLARCFRKMHDLLGQIPTYIIVDALDGCPNTSGVPLCISRPEQDICTIKPLTSQSRRVSLHEGGQKEDINRCFAL